jgi:hypothetical protein
MPNKNYFSTGLWNYAEMSSSGLLTIVLVTPLKLHPITGLVKLPGIFRQCTPMRLQQMQAVTGNRNDKTP